MLAYMNSNSGGYSSHPNASAPAVLFKLDPFRRIATNKRNEVAVIDEEEKKPLPAFEDEEEWSDVSV